MRRYAAVIALLALAAPATAQPTGSPKTFLEAARLDITEDRLADASVALEEAETRILTRSVTRAPTIEPSNQPLIATINEARAAVAATDKAAALEKIDAAMKNPALDASAQ
jgi:hypothetical protein